MELGGGTGVCGLYAACIGASHVTVTDSDEALLKLAHANLTQCCGQTIQLCAWRGSDGARTRCQDRQSRQRRT